MRRVTWLVMMGLCEAVTIGIFEIVPEPSRPANATQGLGSVRVAVNATRLARSVISSRTTRARIDLYPCGHPMPRQKIRSTPEVEFE
jgi:hypothetical protein